VAICDAVHGTHNKSSKILHAHQRSYLCISTEWSTGTRESVLYAGIIFYPQRLSHPHLRLDSGNTELLKDAKVHLDEILHRRSYVVVSHKSKLTHI